MKFKVIISQDSNQKRHLKPTHSSKGWCSYLSTSSRSPATHPFIHSILPIVSKLSNLHSERETGKSSEK